MDFIIEIQGFHTDKGALIPKEVAVVSVNKNFTAHWVISPVCNFSDLPISVRRENNWLTLYKHGIEWFEGDVPEKYLFANLRDLSKHARLIYTRGTEKANLLQQVMAREVINMDEDVQCPSFDKLPSSEEYCILHYTKNFSADYKCALNEAKRLKRWLVNLSTENLQEKCVKEDEHSTNTGYSSISPSLHLRCLSLGSDSEILDKACNYCV